ncbi:MAG: IS701 family transposase [Bryobacteraceae bacterium]
MSTTRPDPGAQEKRFAAYLEGLGKAAGHRDREQPLKDYCRGLLLPGERKSIEPMAARLHPEQVQAARQSMHHLVAKAPWSDEALLAAVQRQVVPAMTRRQPIVGWIVYEVGIPKRGRHSVGVARQECGAQGKKDNCQVAVTLSVATWEASLPVAYRLYLPREWADDWTRRRKAGVPEEIEFQTKPEIAFGQIRAALNSELPFGVVMADAVYGADARFREQLRRLDLQYVVGVQADVSLWRPGEEPPAAGLRGKPGRPSRLPGRSRENRPVSARELVLEFGEEVCQTVSWRRDTNRRRNSRFLALRVRPAHRRTRYAEPHEEQWLLAEWPKGAAEPVEYWLSNLPPETSLGDLVRLAKHRWVVERDFQELKQELGLGHFEGRSWRGFHHHATLVIAAYGFLVAERSCFSPSARAGRLALAASELPADYRPRGSRAEA